MTTRVLLKIIFALLLSLVAVAGGHRAILGRWPSVTTAVLLTAVVFGAIVILDAAYGW